MDAHAARTRGPSSALATLALLACAPPGVPPGSVDAEPWLIGTDLEVLSLEADAHGNVFAEGTALGPASLAGVEVDPVEGYVWLGRLRGDGEAAWVTATPLQQSPAGLALDGSGQAWTGGAFRGHLEIGAGLDSPGDGDDDALAAAWDASGRPAAAFTRGGRGQDNVGSLTGWDEGVVVGGWLSEDGDRRWDAWLAALDTHGDVRWEHRLGEGGGGTESIDLVVAGSGGDVLVAGQSSGALALGGQTLPEGPWLALFAADGDLAWARPWDEPVEGMALDEQGGCWIRTRIGGMYVSDPKITRLAPDGAVAWTWTVSGYDLWVTSPLRPDDRGAIWFAGAARPFEGEDDTETFAPFVGGLDASGAWIGGRRFAEGVSDPWAWSYLGAPAFALGPDGHAFFGGPLATPLEIDGVVLDGPRAYIASVELP